RRLPGGLLHRHQAGIRGNRHRTHDCHPCPRTAVAVRRVHRRGDLMARREYVSRFPCAETGCTERSYYVDTTRREQQQTYANQQRKPWRCYRHSGANTLLSLDNPERVAVMTAERVQTDRGNVLPTLYWDGAVDVV